MSTVPFDPADLISLEEVAKRLHQDTNWVRSKVRPRSPNPMPVRNLGRHLIFSWTEVSEWIRRSPTRLKHAAHPPRRKKLKTLKAA